MRDRAYHPHWLLHPFLPPSLLPSFAAAAAAVLVVVAAAAAAAVAAAPTPPSFPEGLLSFFHATHPIREEEYDCLFS